MDFFWVLQPFRSSKISSDTDTNMFFSNYFIKNAQTTNSLTFLTHNISAIGGVKRAASWATYFSAPSFNSGGRQSAATCQTHWSNFWTVGQCEIGRHKLVIFVSDLISCGACTDNYFQKVPFVYQRLLAEIRHEIIAMYVDRQFKLNLVIKTNLRYVFIDVIWQYFLFFQRIKTRTDHQEQVVV